MAERFGQLQPRRPISYLRRKQFEEVAVDDENNDSEPQIRQEASNVQAPLLNENEEKLFERNTW